MLYRILYKNSKGHWIYEGTIYKCNNIKEAYLHAVETARQLGDGRWHVEFL